jgi:CBS domain containing-hemolysin-like protein
VSGLWPWAGGTIAALAAAIFSTADSALLAVHAAEVGGTTSVGFSDRERTHRALSMARVLAYVACGTSFARALSLSSRAPVERPLLIAIVAIAVCLVAEGGGRAIGYADSSAIFERLGPVARIVVSVLRPVVSLGSAIDHAVQSAIPRGAANDEERETSAEQFRDVVAAEADVSGRERELIRGVFSLGDTEVQEIMVPRVDIIAVDASTPWSEVLDRIRSSEHARLPVYRETLDDVIGILYAKDALPAIIGDDEPAAGWESLVRPPSLIPISKRIDAQLREFQASRTHIAIVIDEYGGTAGLVTIEDILEEIVGEIRDEHDVEEPPIHQEGGRFWVSARVPVEDLSERLGADFGVHDVATVGGLVYALFGRVPASGESILHSRFRIVVERVRGRRIERVYFERLVPARAPTGRDE